MIDAPIDSVEEAREIIRRARRRVETTHPDAPEVPDYALMGGAELQEERAKLLPRLFAACRSGRADSQVSHCLQAIEKELCRRRNGHEWQLRYDANEPIRQQARERRRENPAASRAVAAARRAARLRATPKWANHKYIQLWYKFARLEEERTGRQCHVDHIVPLRSRIVSGLHCEHNLQIMFAEANNSKGNRTWPDMP